MKIRRFVIPTFLLLTIFMASSSWGNTPDRYVGDTAIYYGTGTSAPPNVLFIIDNSDGMMRGSGTEPYEPSIFYPGRFQSNEVRKELRSGEFQAFWGDYTNLLCAEAVNALGTYGFYNQGIDPKTGDCSDNKNHIADFYLGNLINKIETEPIEPTVWAPSATYSIGDLVKPDPENTANYINGVLNPYTYVSRSSGTSGTDEPIWPLYTDEIVDLVPWGVVTDGSITWEITSTMLQTTQEVLKQVVGALSDQIRVGVGVFGPNNQGAHVLAEIKDICNPNLDPMPFHCTADSQSNFDNLMEKIDLISSLKTTEAQQVSSALYDAWLYFRGENHDTTKEASGTVVVDGTQYDVRARLESPIEWWCQPNHVFVLTTGSTSPSAQMIQTIGDYNKDQLFARPDDAAKFIYDGDLNQNSLIQPLPLKTNIIQLMTSYVDELDRATDQSHGRGEYFLANNTNELIEALLESLSAIVREAETSFIAPVVPASPENRAYSGERIYIGFFKPITGQPWQGNLKKYGLREEGGELRIFDKEGVLATDENGNFKSGATSYWSDEADGVQVDAGGVGGVMKSGGPDNRKIWMGIDVNNSYSLVNFNRSNVTSAMLGITSQWLGLTVPASCDPACAEAIKAEIEAESTRLVNFVRGKDAYAEEGLDVDAGREWFMGDILHSRPLVVTYNQFEEFTAAKEADPKINKSYIFVGTNDGMLHAFRDHDGSEAWSFIPPDIVDRLKYLRDPAYDYYVDASPVIYLHDANRDGCIGRMVGDECILEDSEVSEDKAILIFGLRRGGGWENLGQDAPHGAYYAMDVTNPENPTFLWKIDNKTPGFGALGQTWSQPRFARVKIGEERKIVAFVGAGYDNIEDMRYGNTQSYPAVTATGPTEDYAKGVSSGDVPAATAVKRGNGVYAIEVATLSPVEPVTDNLPTTFEASTSTYGAIIWSFTGMEYAVPSDVLVFDSDNDSFADRLYVGDTGGNLWRFNLSSFNTQDWTNSAHRIFTSNPGSDGTNGRKIFYPPDATIRDYNNIVLYFGTGDRAHPLNYKTPGVGGAVIDRLYAVRDQQDYNYATNGSLTEEENLVDFTNASGVVPADKYGWYIRLEDNAGEKVLAQASVFNKVAYYTTYQPDPEPPPTVDFDPCATTGFNVGTARLFAVNASTGEGMFRDANDDPVRDEVLGIGIPAAPTYVRDKDGKVRRIIIKQKDVIPGEGVTGSFEWDEELVDDATKNIIPLYWMHW